MSSPSCLPLGVHLSECRGLCSRLAAGVGCRCARAPRIPHPSEQHIRVFGNIAMPECRVRHVRLFRNIFGGHNAGRMYGNILLAECSSAFSCLWCRRTTSGRLGNRHVTRARTCFTPSGSPLRCRGSCWNPAAGRQQPHQGWESSSPPRNTSRPP